MSAHSDYQTLLDATLEFANRRESLTPSEKAVIDAYESAEPYEKCLELLRQVEGRA